MTNSIVAGNKESFDLEAILRKGLPKKGDVYGDLAIVRYALDQIIDYEGFIRSIDFIAIAKKAKLKTKAELEDLMMSLLIKHSVSKIFQNDVAEKSDELFSFSKAETGQASKFCKLYFGNPELGVENSTLIYSGNDLSLISKILSQGDSCYFIDRIKEAETPNLIKNPVLNFILVKCLIEMAASRKFKFNEVLCKNFITGILVGDFDSYMHLSDEHKSLIYYHTDSIWNKAVIDLHKSNSIQSCAAELFIKYETITNELINGSNQFLAALAALKAVCSGSNGALKNKK